MVSRLLNLKGRNLNEDFDGKEVDFEVVSNKDIAIIGISGKFASARNIDEYWKVITNKIDCIDKFVSAGTVLSNVS